MGDRYVQGLRSNGDLNLGAREVIALLADRAALALIIGDSLGSDILDGINYAIKPAGTAPRLEAQTGHKPHEINDLARVLPITS